MKKNNPAKIKNNPANKHMSDTHIPSIQDFRFDEFSQSSR